MSAFEQARAEIAKLPGIKEDELVKCGPCPLCKKPIISLEHGLTFYRITIRRAMLDLHGIKRRMGLGMMLGNDTLARAMGPNDDLAKIFDGPHEIVVHEECAAEVGHLLQLVEKGEQ